MHKCKKEGFQVIYVPDILKGKIIEGCGMPITGERTQVSGDFTLKILRDVIFTCFKDIQIRTSSW